MGTTENEKTLLEYIAAMDACDYATAIEAFADNIRYVHPPLPAKGSPPGTMGPPGTTVVEGRGQLRVFFDERGTYPTRHDLHTVVSSDKDTFAEGVVRLETGDREVTILLHAHFDEAGRIADYIALK